MPWGWECRDRLVKQRPMRFTERRGPISLETKTPGPQHYETPELLGKAGYSKIQRLPAYTFGYMTKPINKPSAKPNAPMFNLRGTGPKGAFRIPGSLVTPHIEGVPPKTKVPGPGTYVPRGDSRYKRSPAYTMRLAARPPYQPWDMWTPPPNMYCPPIPDKRPPAYSFGPNYKPLPIPPIPGPGTHEPNFNFVKKTKPAFSFGAPFKPEKPLPNPPPNTYCEKKFNVNKPSAPAITFGIQHTPYLGVLPPYLKSSKLDRPVTGAS